MRKSGLNAGFPTGFDSFHTSIFPQKGKDKRVFSATALINQPTSYPSSD